MWKYIEGKFAKSEKGARAHFGINEEACPVLELDNGWYAVWCAAPLDAPPAYPQLSHAPTNRKAGFHSVKA
jgi:hypothetical protein